MSIHTDKKGRLVVVSDSCTDASELWLNRRRAIVTLIQNQSECMYDPVAIYEAAEMLQDMEPNFEQAKRLFSSGNSKT